MNSKHPKFADVRRALSSEEVNVHPSTVVGHDDDLDLESFPWIDLPW